MTWVISFKNQVKHYSNYFCVHGIFTYIFIVLVLFCLYKIGFLLLFKPLGHFWVCVVRKYSNLKISQISTISHTFLRLTHQEWSNGSHFQGGIFCSIYLLIFMQTYFLHYSIFQKFLFSVTMLIAIVSCYFSYNASWLCWSWNYFVKFQ